jgi:hypothetical protein
LIDFFSEFSWKVENAFWEDLQILNAMMFQICRSGLSGDSLSLPEFSRTLKGLADFFSDNFNQNSFARSGETY